MLLSRTLPLLGTGRVQTSQNAQSNADEQGAWARPVEARLAEVVAALALLACAVFFVGLSVLLPFGRVQLPGPGFFPFALGIALAGLAVAIIVLAWRGKMAEASVVFLGHRDVLVTFAAMMGLAAAFEQADSYLVLGIFTAVVLILVGKVELWRAALGATLGMVTVWAVFRVALGVRLPAADFWRLATDLVTARLPGPF